MSEISSIFCGTMYFTGLIDNLSAHGNLGYVAVYEDRMYIHNGNDWESLDVISELGHDAEQKKKVTTQCRNCGAVIDENGWCPYCETYN